MKTHLLLKQPRARWTIAAALLLGGIACLMMVFKSGAANPTSGTITPTSAPVAWDGTALGGTSPGGEPTCMEGVNCDTFTLTVVGTPADWLGKAIRVDITWVVLANDYDLYVHKNDNNGPLVGSSTGGAPGISETVTIHPSDLDASGTTVFTAHVVYFTGAAADQPHGTATVISTGLGATPTPTPPPLSNAWTIKYHGQCCEGNLAAAGDNTFVLLPVLIQGNRILKSADGGVTWTEKYPPVGVSVPFGIEGDMQAYKNDVIFFGTELADVVVARSEDFGETFSITHFPIASGGNDQAWSYLGPLKNMRPSPPGPLPGDEEYVYAGWMRIGAAAVFSFDGGLTFPIQTPLVGNNGSGPKHIVCQQNAHAPIANPPPDTRVANADFIKQKSGRHGAWGTDRKFYWSETTPESLYVCSTADYGLNWTGVKHPLGTYPGSDFVVTHSAFDDKGTLYVLHGNRLYISFNRGESWAYIHTLPHYGTALRSDKGADQYFVVSCGTAHVAVLENAGNGAGRVYYLRGNNVDTATPTWDVELVDQVENVRLDFMYITINGNGIPTISYTTPGTQVTTASRNAPMPGGSVCAFSRKTHGPGATPFDVQLPLTGSPGVECRTGGAAGDYQVIVNFPAAVTVGGVSLGTAAGSVQSSSVSHSTVTVNLTGITSPQLTTIRLQDVNTGTGVSDILVPLATLLGDVNGDRTVNVGDTLITRNASGQLANADHFRADVNLDGTVDVGDAIIVRDNSGQTIPEGHPRERARR